jgi:hypothetical protein
MEQDEFFAELSLSGYRCDHATTIQESAEAQRVLLHGRDGLIKLRGIGV